MNSGYVKVHRAILHHWLWEDPKQLRAWLYLLFEAGWERREIPFGDGSLTLERGQLSTTIRKLNGAWGYYSEATLRLLNLFERYDMIKRKSYPTMTIITIVNYDEYQLDRLDTERKSKRKSKHIKEDKKMEEEKYTINSISISRELDLNFLEELKKSDLFFEQCAMTLKIDISTIKDFLERFTNEMLIQEKYHNSLADYRQHFFNWVKIQINKGARQKNNNNNGTGQKETKNKHDSRRGTYVGNHTADDYGGTF